MSKEDYLKKMYKYHVKNGFVPTGKMGNIHVTLQPQTKEYLKNYNITTISFEKMDLINQIALDIRSMWENKKGCNIFDYTMIEYYNHAGIVIDKIVHGVGYIKDVVDHNKDIQTDEEKALLAMFLIDPNMNYYHTYQDNQEDSLNVLQKHYGFVSKELLQVERLYDFVKRYRQNGKDEESIQYMANKLYNIDKKAKGR